MSDPNRLASKILALENDEEQRATLREFCKEFNLKGVFAANQFRLLDTLHQRINVGAVILAEDGRNTIDLLEQINTRHPEIPVFISCYQPDVFKNFRPFNESSVVRFFPRGDMKSLQKLLSDTLFYRVYPEGLVEKMQEIVSTGIMAQFRGVKVIKERSFLASDKRIYGERFELISVRSNWCEGMMMIQSHASDVDDMIRVGRTAFNPEDGDIKHYSEDLLRELLNFTWGGFKSKFVPPEFTGRPINIEVPMSINHQEKYISFGVTDPLLCFKFRVEDDDSSLPPFRPFQLYLKFSFHLFWDPDHFHENPETEELTASGELEFF
ncbi:Hypothetical protein HDN1F_28070 [gamma proteobacterium HdN1]|nr:Hypothetical protein HDN1F_28070 [gamma proteobacterium HdN1]